MTPRIDPRCPSRVLPFQIGGKWTGMVLVCLADEPLRFTALRAPLRSITPKVLAETLRAMERDGLVRRTELPAHPPHVEYALTDLGRSLLPVIDAFRAWCRDHLDDLTAARERHSAFNSVVDNAAARTMLNP